MVRPVDDAQIELVQSIQRRRSSFGSPTRKEEKCFTFDHIFWSTKSDDSNYANQQTIFNTCVLPLLSHAFQGFNTCVFAYGQTGSGKTHTMFGSEEGAEAGIIPRLGEEVFARISHLISENIEAKVTASYYEIYNEKVKDLIVAKKENLKVREHPLKGPYVEDLSVVLVTKASDIAALLKKGQSARTVHATNMNQHSSRSHAIFTLTLAQTSIHDSDLEKVSKLHFVDLAGSERVKASGTSGDRLREGAEINKSLSTLGRVISTLVQNMSSSPQNKSVVPYRESTLTWLLKDALGGNSMTRMIATVAPGFTNYEPTLSTLRFADGVKRISNKAVINEDSNTKLIRELKKELEDLRKQVNNTAQLSNENHDDKQELMEKLAISEKLLLQVNISWEEKLKEREALLEQQTQDTLKNLGIGVQDNELMSVHTPTKLPFLMNLSDTLGPSDLLMYTLRKGYTKVGTIDNTLADIKLSGDETINYEHCHISYDGNTETLLIKTNPENAVFVNGAPFDSKIQIHNGDRIILGDKHLFRYTEPRTPRPSVSMDSQALLDDISQFRKHRYERSISQSVGTSPGSWRLRSPSSLSESPTRKSDVHRHSTLTTQVPYAFPSLVYTDKDRLTRKFFHKWVNTKLVAHIHRLFFLSCNMLKLQKLSNMLNLGINFQFVVSDDLRKSPYESDNILCSPVYDHAFPQLSVRAMDFRNESIHLFSPDYIFKKIPLIDFGQETPDNISLSKTFSFPRIHSFIGSSEIIITDRASYTSDIISPYNHLSVGILTLILTPNKVDSSSSDCSITLTGLSQDEYYDAHVLINLGQASYTTPACEITSGKISFPTKYNVKFDDEDPNLLKAYIFSHVKKTFIQRLISWDEMQELGIPDKIKQDIPSQTVGLSLKILELNEQGLYIPVEVVHPQDQSFPDYFFLHQGLQREIEITFICESSFESKFESIQVKLVDFTLVDSNARPIKQEDCEVILPQIGELQRHHLSKFTSLKVLVRWTYNSSLLDKVTLDTQQVFCNLVAVVDNTLYPIKAILSVKPRSSASSSRWSAYFALSNPTSRQQMNWFTVSSGYNDPPKRLEDFTRYVDSGSVRGVSLIKEYLEYHTQRDRVCEVSRLRQIYKDITFDKKDEQIEFSSHDAETLCHWLDLWKSKVPTKMDTVSWKFFLYL